MTVGLWARITGKDKDLRRPNQQASALGALGDVNVASPYGLWADLPNDALLTEVAPGVFMSMTEGRPSDTEQGEPVFFHPATNTRIIARNNGDLDISTVESGGNVNIEAVSANITASNSVTIDTPETTITGNLAVQGDTALGATVTSNGKDISDTHAHGGSATAPTGAISPTGMPV